MRATIKVAVKLYVEADQQFSSKSELVETALQQLVKLAVEPAEKQKDYKEPSHGLWISGAKVLGAKLINPPKEKQKAAIQRILESRLRAMEVLIERLIKQQAQADKE